MKAALLLHISSLLGTNIRKFRSLHGGDIAQAFHLESEGAHFFCKLLTGPEALNMLRAERMGLEEISRTKAIRTPEVRLCGSFEDKAFLIMEFVKSKQPSKSEMTRFGAALAKLHLTPKEVFGWDSDNYIGLLPQSNKIQEDWPTFYTKERLLPQFRMALEKRLLVSSELPTEAKMYDLMHSLAAETFPSVLHGDLWSGNYMISEQGDPYLIDPAVYFGHHEVDIAMSLLFGGFDSSFYAAYHEFFPKEAGFEDRIQIYQLYYLLVHLNLFGSSYYHSVSRILKRFF